MYVCMYVCMSIPSEPPEVQLLHGVVDVDDPDEDGLHTRIIYIIIILIKCSINIR